MIKQVIDSMIDCQSKHRDFSRTLLSIVLPIILTKVAFSCIIVPCLLKNLRGRAKLFHFLQQFSADLYLLSIIVPSVLDVLILDREDAGKIWAEAHNVHKYYAFGATTKALGTIFFYQQYAFSLLLTLNYYNMICKSLKFREYSRCANVIKRVFTSSLICAILSVHHIPRCVNIFYQSVGVVSLIEGRSDLDKTIRQAANLQFIMESTSIFEAVEVAILKVVYTCVLIFIGIKVKLSLYQSSELRNSENDDHNSTIFFTFCLVPLINNFIFILSDISKVIVTFHEANYTYESNSLTCRVAHDKYRLRLHLPFTASVFLVTCIIQCSAYLHGFSHLRKGFCTANVLCRGQCLSFLHA